MNRFKNPITCLYIKNNQANWIPVTKQTQSRRDLANDKIRILGNKYFNVKRLFEQMNLKKDFLFNIGRELEELFKNKKKIDHLQTQAKRMKEWILIWYAEFFYDEIFQNDPIVIQLLQGKRAINNSPKQISESNNNPILFKENSETSVPHSSERYTKSSLASNYSIKNQGNKKKTNDTKFNKEIDSFDDIYDTTKNTTNQSSCYQQNNNFDFSQLFNL